MEQIEESRLEKELNGARRAKKAPPFKVRHHDYQNQWRSVQRELRQKFQLSLLLAGRRVEATSGRVIYHVKNDQAANQGRSMFFEIIDEAFRGALEKRWPEFHSTLEEVCVEARALHAIDDGSNHQAQVCLYVRLGKKERSVLREGADIICLLVEALADVYCWVAWRLLRRQRGAERNNNAG